MFADAVEQGIRLSVGKGIGAGDVYFIFLKSEKIGHTCLNPPYLSSKKDYPPPNNGLNDYIAWNKLLRPILLAYIGLIMP